MMCVDCERYSLKDRPEHASKGFGTCSLRSKFIIYGALRDHDCGHYIEATPDVRDSRREWLRRIARSGSSAHREASC